MNTLIEIYAYYIQLLNKNYSIDKYIIEDSKYAFYFWNCLKTLDRTYIEGHILYKKCIPYQNWKNILSQNIFIVCNDMAT